MKRTLEEECIFQALASVQTPPAALEEGIRARLAGRRSSCRPRRMVLVCACLLVILAAAAAAAGLNDAWRYFFTSPLPADAVTSLDLSQTSGDYTLTLEDAAADDRQVLLLLSLTRTDGGPIDPELELGCSSMRYAPTLSLEDGSTLSLHTLSQPQLSADQTTLYFVLRASLFDRAGSLNGHTLTLDVFSLGKTPYSQTVALSLAELPAAQDITYDRTDFSGVSTALSHPRILPVPAAGGLSGAVLRGAVMLETRGLSIGISTPDMGVRENVLCEKVYPNALIDTRTGARYDHGSMHSYTLETGEQVSLYSFQNCPLTPEDLPWLELEVAYLCIPVVPDTTFSLSFQADTSASISVPLEEMTLSGHSLPLQALHITPLQISLVGAGGDLTPYSFLYDEPQPVCYVTGTDGSTVPLVCTGGSVNEYAGRRCCTLSFSRADPADLFWDTGWIASVTIGDQTIPVQP